MLVKIIIQNNSVYKLIVDQLILNGTADWNGTISASSSIKPVGCGFLFLFLL